MPRVERRQKEYERLLIRELLGHLRYRISRPRWQESPDAVLTLSKGKTDRKRIAIEHTDYFNDTVAGKRSPLTPIADFWKAVQGSLIRRISHRRHLTGILARARLKENLPRPRDSTEVARQLARKLVAFAEDHPVSISHHLTFRGREFGGYAVLEALCNWLLLSRWTDDVVGASRCAWVCCNINTGAIGLNLSYIKSAIQNKNSKAAGYPNWGDAEEKWLLIAASGSNLSNQAGPRVRDDAWADPALTELCRSSPFDRIVFWERIRDWYKPLKPSGDAVQYRDPYVSYACQEDSVP